MIALVAATGRLTELEQANLSAAVFRVLPSDDGCGAREAGCDRYLASLLDRRASEATVRDFKAGLSMLEDLANQVAGRSFHEAPEPQQDAVLKHLQQTPHPKLQRFFRNLVSLTIEGFLSDPRRGGNRDGVGWSYLGIQGARRPGACLKEGACTTS